MRGWIKLYRQLEESSFFKDSEAVHLWITLLLKAARKKEKVFINNQIIELLPGQILTGRKKLAKETGINDSKIFRLLKMFEKSEQQIEQQTNSRYSIITIKNWTSYQQSKQQIEHIQEDKKEKKNIINIPFFNKEEENLKKILSVLSKIDDYPFEEKKDTDLAKDLLLIQPDIDILLEQIIEWKIANRRNKKKPTQLGILYWVRKVTKNANKKNEGNISPAKKVKSFSEEHPEYFEKFDEKVDLSTLRKRFIGAFNKEKEL